jgi:glycogen debranching enzyme
LSPLTESTFEDAIEVLRSNSTRWGLRASHAYYNQVWARDAFISLLGANLLHDETLLRISRRNIDVFSRTRAPLGQIANFFDLETGSPEYGWSGSTDSSGWYILGLASLYDQTGDESLLGEPFDAAMDAYRFLRHQDANNTWLVDSPQGSDWMDAAVQRTGKTLYNNVLFLAATRALSGLFSVAGRSRADSGLLPYRSLRQRLTDVFLPDPAGVGRISKYWPRLATLFKHTNLPDDPLDFFIHYISFARVDLRFDTLSNLLSILTGLASRRTALSILRTIKARKLNLPFPVRVLDPPYRRGEEGYDRAFDDTLPVQHRSRPFQYHNGAVWPFVGGFYVCVLNSIRNRQPSLELESLARANMVFRPGETVGFNEWLDGKTGKAKGQFGQSWSAGMYIAAYLSTRGKNPFAFLG